MREHGADFHRSPKRQVVQLRTVRLQEVLTPQLTVASLSHGRRPPYLRRLNRSATLRPGGI